MRANDGIKYDDKGFPVLQTERGTLFDYDLNIYHLEEQDPSIDLLEYPYTKFKYTDQWYVDIYEYIQENGASNQVHVAGPFVLTDDERDRLGLQDGSWDDDAWYGLWGFLKDYGDKAGYRLHSLFATLPKYKEELLF